MLQEVLPYIAIALQWARAQAKFSEVYFALIVVVSSFGFYLMAHPTDAFSQPWNLVVAGWWEQAKTILASVQATSTVANIAVKMGMSNKSPLIPVTAK